MIFICSKSTIGTLELEPVNVSWVTICQRYTDILSALPSYYILAQFLFEEIVTLR